MKIFITCMAVLSLLVGSGGCSRIVDMDPILFLTGENHSVKRYHAAKGYIRMKGRSAQQILDLLGEPSSVVSLPKEGVEQWEFIYYDPPRNEISGKKNRFVLTLREDRVQSIQNTPLASQP